MHRLALQRACLALQHAGTVHPFKRQTKVSQLRRVDKELAWTTPIPRHLGIVAVRNYIVKQSGKWRRTILVLPAKIPSYRYVREQLNSP